MGDGAVRVVNAPVHARVPGEVRRGNVGPHSVADRRVAVLSCGVLIYVAMRGTKQELTPNGEAGVLSTDPGC